MNQDNWQEAKEIFNQALKLSGSQRAKYLDNVSLKTPLLGEQVKTLLEYYKSEFLEDPPIHQVAEIIGGSRLKIGQQIGHYEIKKILGIGGMGEVFLAQDLELKRSVAIKILHQEVAADKDRISRFIQEARAASALNHPNILTIHEIGKFEDSPYIVSEYIKGETLREKLKKKNLSLAESLEITSQIATALEAAHEAGIVHRDIKPENIMLRKDGLVKVLDFGLAKLLSQRHGDAETRGHGEDEQSKIQNLKSKIERSKIQNLTSPGMVMGTVAYMSPEQARGKAVDARTDIWSLGVVLYEMLSGKQPFVGETTSDIIASILKTEAESLESLGKEIPRELESICLKALAKDKNKRYQTAQDFLEDLKGEKKRMENVMEQAIIKPFNIISEQETKPIRVPPTLSAEYLVTSVKRHKLAFLSSLLVIGVLAVGVTFYNFNAAPQPGKFNSAVPPVINADTTEKDLKFSRLPTSGQVIEIAISPDGKYIAYVTTIENKRSIRIMQSNGSGDVEIMPPVKEWFTALSFTPDSNHLYYLYSTLDNEEIFKVPVLGGSPTKIADQTDGGGSISPDGKTLAFHREQDQAQLLVLANPDGSNQRTLIKTPFSGNSIHCGAVPAWSPDGQKIACGLILTEGNERYVKLLSIKVADGSQEILSEHKWAGSGRAVWMPDGNLLINGREKSTGSLNQNSQIWLVVPGAAPKRVTNDPNNYSNISATAKGDVLLTLQSRMMTDLWTLPVSGDALQAKQITFTGEIAGNSGWTPNGQIVFSSGLTNRPDFWIMNPDGTNRKKLTANETADITAPKATADGQYIIFNSNRDSSSMQVFRMDPDGSNVKQLTTGLGAMASKTSPDGKWVYYLQNMPDQTKQICKISIDGGEPVPLVVFPDAMTVNIAIGRKSGRIAYFQRSQVENRWIRKIFITSPEGGEPLKTLELPPSEMEEAGFHWMPDEQALAFRDSRQGITNVWTISVDTGEVKPLTNFTSGQNLGFDFSWDGQQMLISRGLFTSEAVIISRAE